MTGISRKTKIAAAIAVLAFILILTVVIIAVVNRGSGNDSGNETDKASESVGFDDGASETEPHVQTDEKTAPDIRYEGGEVVIDINDLA